VAEIRERAGDDDAVERFHERTAHRYAELLGRSKGLLMKAGQILAMLEAHPLGTDGFGHYRDALARLQTHTPPMHPDLVREVLDDELGSAAEYFAEFTDKPLAAASIGQVHRAVLRDGREVAVKVQYPGVAQAIRDDLANTELVATLMRFMASASQLVKPDVRAAGREAAARIGEEIDYHHEAATIGAFSELYRDHPFIKVPDVVSEACTDRVLTMTFLDGLDWPAAQQANQELKNIWAETILRFSFGNYRHANLLHADPHPGNYRFHPDGTVGFVDFGCVKVMPEPQRWRMVAVNRAVIEGRKHDVRDIMADMGFFGANCDLTADEIYPWYSTILHEYVSASQPVTFSQETTRRIIAGIFDLRDASHPMARMNSPEDLVFTGRVQLALASVCAGLNATMPARAIADDADGVAEPTTSLGKRHHAWARKRGLPSALNHHNHRRVPP
jgi:predicted unusual protein kinase regulating ubiquinone biosynthesis (AarF/ABC1/UbiB family)